MCLGVPMKVVEIQGKNAVGEIRGILQKIRVDFIKDLKLGEYVLVHAGFALQRIEEEQVKEAIEVIKEIQDVTEEFNGKEL